MLFPVWINPNVGWFTLRYLCQTELPVIKPVASPFSNIITLDYYDGSLAGLAWCSKQVIPYTFQAISWDRDQEIRVFVVGTARAITTDEAYKILSPLGSPRIPEWAPSPQGKNPEHTKAIRSLRHFLVSDEIPWGVFAASGVSKEILGANIIDKAARNRVPRPRKTDLPNIPSSQDWEFWRGYLRLGDA